jgi:hypothetical protein
MNGIQWRTKETTYRIGVSGVIENCVNKNLGSDEEQTRLEAGASVFNLGPRFKSTVQMHDLEQMLIITN